MNRILFLAEPATLAHVVRPLMLAASLDSPEYKIFFATDTYYDTVVGGIPGTRIRISTRSPAQFEKVLTHGGELFDEHILRRYIRQEQELLNQVKPDVVISDLRPSMTVSSHLCRVPHLSLTSAYWGPHLRCRTIPPPCIPFSRRLPHNSIGETFFSGYSLLMKALLPAVLSRQGRGLNRVRREHGLPPFADYFTGFTHGDAILYADPGELFDLASLPTSARFLGPLVWSVPVPVSPRLEQFMDRNPEFIFVTLGSSGDPEAFRAAIEGVRLVGRPAIIATAQRFSSGELQAWENDSSLIFEPYVPGDLVARRACAVITNGGSPSTYQALQHGIPVLGLPGNMDQLIFMATARSAAIQWIRADRASAERVASKLGVLVSNAVARGAARNLSEGFRQYDPARSLREMIDFVRHSSSNERGTFAAQAV